MKSSSSVNPISIPQVARFATAFEGPTAKRQCEQLLRLLSTLCLPVPPQVYWKSDGTAVVIVFSRYTFSCFGNLQLFLHGILEIDGSLSPEDTQDEVVELLNTFAE